jgi:hypothetical protein
MPGNEAEEILALSLIFVVHVAGGLMLVWGMLDGNSRPGLPWPWRRFRGGGGPDEPPPEPQPPSPPPARARLPLAGAGPSTVRLRDRTPLRDGYERRARRPQRAPDRSPSRR